uniref:Uncharacterized protein n=1 Tax=Rhizophora mucronata TaxID=61149 RepID=A0A2P2QX92_RHIMU
MIIFSFELHFELFEIWCMETETASTYILHDIISLLMCELLGRNLLRSLPVLCCNSNFPYS